MADAAWYIIVRLLTRATGDVCLAGIDSRYPPCALVVDERVGTRILLPV